MTSNFHYFNNGDPVIHAHSLKLMTTKTNLEFYRMLLSSLLTDTVVVLTIPEFTVVAQNKTPEPK